MAISLCEVSIGEAPLAAFAGVGTDAGAAVEFWGMVRPLEDRREITGIDYEAHLAMAEHQLLLVGRMAAATFGLARVEIRHRIGFVAVAEASVFVRVASEHRAAAFAGCQWIMDELKRRVPIWKRPVFKTAEQNTRPHRSTASA